MITFRIKYIIKYSINKFEKKLFSNCFELMSFKRFTIWSDF